jgi:hypothetical protein
MKPAAAPTFGTSFSWWPLPRTRGEVSKRLAIKQQFHSKLEFCWERIDFAVPAQGARSVISIGDTSSITDAPYLNTSRQMPTLYAHPIVTIRIDGQSATASHLL